LLLVSEYDEVTDKALLTAVTTPTLAGLIELGIGVGDDPGALPHKVLAKLSKASHFTRLKKLHLLFADLTPGRMRQLLRSKAFAALTHLNLEFCAATEASWRLLLESPPAGLRWLCLHHAKVERHDQYEMPDLVDEPLAQRFRDRFGDALSFESPDEENVLPLWHGMRWKWASLR